MHGVQVDLRLAAAGDALQQERPRRGGPIFQRAAHGERGMALGLGQHDGPRRGKHVAGQRIAVDGDRIELEPPLPHERVDRITVLLAGIGHGHRDTPRPKVLQERRLAVGAGGHLRKLVGRGDRRVCQPDERAGLGRDLCAGPAVGADDESPVREPGQRRARPVSQGPARLLLRRGAAGSHDLEHPPLERGERVDLAAGSVAGRVVGPAPEAAAGGKHRRGGLEERAQVAGADPSRQPKLDAGQRRDGAGDAQDVAGLGDGGRGGQREDDPLEALASERHPHRASDPDVQRGRDRVAEGAQRGHRGVYRDFGEGHRLIRRECGHTGCRNSNRRPGRRPRDGVYRARRRSSLILAARPDLP